MQIDFHHSVTYVLSRLAGFSHNEAGIISKSAQYVDDNNCDKIIKFDNCAIYKPLLSAHSCLDYQNFDELANHLVWIPFHFLPGNCLERAGGGLDKPLFARLTCLKDSFIAKDMIDECIKKSSDTNSLYRLGITMHVYADTWAHHGFSGVRNNANKVTYCNDDLNSQKLISKVRAYFEGGISAGLDIVCPLGHGAILSYPDRPYLDWKYKDYNGDIIARNNPLDYVEAVKKMYIALVRFKSGRTDNLKEEWVNLFYRLFSEINNEDKTIRHQEWIKMISNGVFGLEPIEISYDESEWEREAFAGSRPCDILEYRYTSEFENSNWKKFNDALIDHHYYLTRKLFPKYGLCIS